MPRLRWCSATTTIEMYPLKMPSLMARKNPIVRRPPWRQEPLVTGLPNAGRPWHQKLEVPTHSRVAVTERARSRLEGWCRWSSPSPMVDVARNRAANRPTASGGSIAPCHPLAKECVERQRALIVATVVLAAAFRARGSWRRDASNSWITRPNASSIRREHNYGSQQPARCSRTDSIP